jgi:hypothetical protein
VKHTLGTTVAWPYAVSAADVDGDGDLDVLSATSTPVAGDVLVWWENDGATDPGFTPHTLAEGDGGHVSLLGADLDGDGDLDIVAAGSPTRVSWFRNRGGQVALPTIDVAQKVLGGGQLEDLLAIDLVHRGRAGDTDVELAALGLRFADGEGQALAVAQVQALIASLFLVLDDGDGRLSGGDPAVVSLATDDVAFTLDGDGVLLWSLPDGDPDLRAAFGSPRQYFVVVETTPDAELQDPSVFQLTHVLPDLLSDPFGAPSRAEDADRDLPLRLEPAADVGTGPIDTELTSASCRAPFDLVLEERTIDDAVVCEAGLEIRAGDGVRVESTGELTLRAGRTVRLSSGFSVAPGGGLQVAIDESLEP